MNTTVLTWICVYLGVISYFGIKMNNACKDATAANEPFSISNFIKNDIVDIVTAFILSFLLLISGDAKTVPGITVDFTSYIKSFITGFGIASVGVNMFLSIFGLGNKTRRITRRKVDKKTNELDKIKNQ